MACILCRLVCGPKKVAVMERWIKSRWDVPNNGQSFFYLDKNQDALRSAHALGKSDPKKAFEEFLAMAEQGSVWSMRQLAGSFMLGDGTRIDKSEEEKWLRRGSEAGDESAMLTLAYEYLEQNKLCEAEALLTEYAEKDFAPALYLLGSVSFRAGKKPQARAFWERAAALGHRRAKCALSKSCIFGKFGIRSISYGFRLLDEIGDEIEKNELLAAGQSSASSSEGKLIALPSPSTGA
jgi:TPR repeat protein